MLSLIALAAESSRPSKNWSFYIDIIRAVKNLFQPKIQKVWQLQQ